MLVFSMLLVIISNVFYHITQKSVPRALNPISALIVAYTVALAGSLLLYPFFRDEGGFLLSFKNVNWSSFVMGAALIGMELGFLLSYRAGWNISKASIFSSSTVTLILIPIGFLIFKESMSFKSVAGIIICMTGLYLING